MWHSPQTSHSFSLSCMVRLYMRSIRINISKPRTDKIALVLSQCSYTAGGIPHFSTSRITSSILVVSVYLYQSLLNPLKRTLGRMQYNGGPNSSFFSISPFWEYGNHLTPHVLLGTSQSRCSMKINTSDLQVVSASIGLSILFIMQPVYLNSLLSQLPKASSCHLESRDMKSHHCSGQLDLGNIAAFPTLDANKLSLSDFKVADWLQLT